MAEVKINVPQTTEDTHYQDAPKRVYLDLHSKGFDVSQIRGGVSVHIRSTLDPSEIKFLAKELRQWGLTPADVQNHSVYSRDIEPAEALMAAIRTLSGE